MYRLALITLIGLSAVLCQNNNNLPCGFSCSRRTEFLTNIDGTTSRVTCSDRSPDPRARCDSCCAARGFVQGLSRAQSSGFLGTNGDCICCFSNNQCATNPGRPIPAFAPNNGRK